RAPAAPGTSAPLRPPARRGVLFTVVAAAIVVAMVAAGYLWKARSSPVAHPAGAAAEATLEVTQLTSAGNVQSPAISPDARFIGYVRRDKDGDSLWIHQLATSSDARILPPGPGVIRGLTIAP